MSAVPSETTPESVHCDTCNSDIEPRNFLKVTWTGEPGPACPNCNTLIGMATMAEPTPFHQIDNFLVRSGNYCTNCGSSLPPALTDQPNYCPHCGRPVEQNPEHVQWRNVQQTPE